MVQDSNNEVACIGVVGGVERIGHRPLTAFQTHGTYRNALAASGQGHACIRESAPCSAGGCGHRVDPRATGRELNLDFVTRAQIADIGAVDGLGGRTGVPVGGIVRVSAECGQSGLSQHIQHGFLGIATDRAAHTTQGEQGNRCSSRPRSQIANGRGHGRKHFVGGDVAVGKKQLVVQHAGASGDNHFFRLTADGATELHCFADDGLGVIAKRTGHENAVRTAAQTLRIHLRAGIHVNRVHASRARNHQQGIAGSGDQGTRGVQAHAGGANIAIDRGSDERGGQGCFAGVEHHCHR